MSKSTFLHIPDHKNDGFNTLRRHASEPHCGLANDARRDGARSSYPPSDDGIQTTEASRHNLRNSTIFNLEFPLGSSSLMQPKPEVLSGTRSSSSMHTQPISDMRAWELRDPTKGARVSSPFVCAAQDYFCSQQCRRLGWKIRRKVASSSSGAAISTSAASSSMQSKFISDDSDDQPSDLRNTTSMSRSWKPHWPVGAARHSTGDCKPCPWTYKTRGCSAGEMCDECHLCDQEAYKQYRKKRLSSLKANRLLRKNKNSM